MEPAERFLLQPKSFWANVRTVSQKHGYATKAKGIKVPSLSDVRRVYAALGLTADHVAGGTTATEFGALLLDYFAYRADVLNNHVRHLLMDAEEAKILFEEMRDELQPAVSPADEQTEG